MFLENREPGENNTMEKENISCSSSKSQTQIRWWATAATFIWVEAYISFLSSIQNNKQTKK